MNQNLFVNDEPKIVHRYQYGLNDEPIHCDNDQES